MKAVILEGDSVNPGDISWEPVTRLCETKIYGNTSENEKWERINDCEIVLKASMMASSFSAGQVGTLFFPDPVL